MKDRGQLAIHDEFAELRWEALKDFGHDEFVNQLLSSGRFCAGEERDRKEALLEILSSLKTLCGSEEAATRWLFRHSFFSEAAGSPPYLSLENHEFWPMQVMLDWLKVFLRMQEDGTATFPELFPGD
jgi:hypothetical protein